MTRIGQEQRQWWQEWEAIVVNSGFGGATGRASRRGRQSGRYRTRSSSMDVTRLAWLVMAACGLGGCMHWVPAGVSPRVAVDSLGPSEVRLTNRAGDRFTLHAPGIRNDSIVGWSAEPSSEGAFPRAVPPSEVEFAEVRRPNGLATAGLVLGSLAVAAGGIFAIVMSSLPEN